MIRATDWRPLERNSLRGFLTLELPSGLVLRECTYHRAATGAEWIGLPGKPQLDRFQAAALAAVHEPLATAEAAA